jgi:hypothetical protein
MQRIERLRTTLPRRDEVLPMNWQETMNKISWYVLYLEDVMLEKTGLPDQARIPNWLLEPLIQHRVKHNHKDQLSRGYNDKTYHEYDIKSAIMELLENIHIGEHNFLEYLTGQTSENAPKNTLIDTIWDYWFNKRPKSDEREVIRRILHHDETNTPDLKKVQQ